MMTFHNDVSDLTIVYILVLLFRQLCSTPLDNGGALPASVGSIVQRQLKTIKGEIWCLLNDANLCFRARATCRYTYHRGCSQSTHYWRGWQAIPWQRRRLCQAGSPAWRRAMQNVLLQVAARASAVQSAARQGSSDPSTVKTAAPSAATQKILNSWMDTNLRSGSALNKICQRRLRDVVLSMLSEKVRSGLQPTSSSSSVTPAVQQQFRVLRVTSSVAHSRNEPILSPARMNARRDLRAVKLSLLLRYRTSLLLP